ncbi:unnamed protein product [Camellia sinensis]
MPLPQIFLSGFVKLLFEKMTSFASSKLPAFEGIDTQLTNWTKMLRQIEAVLIDAEEKQMTVPAVNLWLDDLQDLAYDLDDLVDEFATEALQHKLKSKIIKLLVKGDESSDNNIGVIPIVGMGGIGKTTLAQMVYKDETVKEYFNLKAWVCVSNEFDIMKITKTIYDSVTSQTCSFNNLDQAQVELQKALAGRKFLIILDDVWNEDYNAWNVLKKPFNDGAQGSKVVVTTRNRDIATMMATVELHNVKILSDEDCWSLFAQHAFANTSIDANPNLVSIGKKIVEKCKGLPLAARTLGGLLRNKVRDEEWVNVLHSKIWDLPHNKSDILPALRLSYHDLPSHLKQCFAYCSIIPNDYEFEEEELVLLLMAEGFIIQQKEKQMEDVGAEYFHELLSRSFFQPSSTSKSSKFVMHDLINDLAQVVARDTCFRIEDRLKDQDQYKNLKKARHSSYMQQYYEGMKQFEIIDKAMHLRTFLPFGIKYRLGYNLASNVPLNLFPKLKRLRVLSMSRYFITELPNSVGDLKHLRYLNLSYSHIKELPESLGSLYNLQTLMLRECKKLKKLPLDMGNLIDLRHLDTTGADSIEELPMRIELGNLIYLQGKLCLSGLQNVVNPLDAREVNLNDKKGLYVLSMEWSVNSDDSRDGRVETEVLDKLQPHKNLKELHIKGYLDTGFPTWIGDSLFSNMANLSLESCGNCASFPPLGQLPSLKKLYIKGMSVLKHVGCEFYGQGGVQPFPLLETLSFENMLEWEDWYTFEDHKEVQPFTPMNGGPLTSLETVLEMGSMADDEVISANAKCKHPSLITSLSIGMIKKLELLPKWVTHGLMELKALKITSCEELKTLWKDEVRVQHSLLAFRSLQIRGCPQLVSLFEEDKDEANEGQHQQQQEEGLPCIARLEHLRIYNCEKLEKLPQLLHTFTFLQELYVYNCPSLGSFPKTGFPCTLKTLKIRNCEALQSLFGWITQINDNNLERWGSVRIWGCYMLKYLPDALPNNNNLRNLSRLILYGCKNLEYIPEGWFHSATNLTYLNIRGCQKLKALPHKLQSINYLTSLQELYLNISEWNNFKKIGLHSLSSLKILLIEGKDEEHSVGSSFPIDGMLLPTSLIDLHISGFRNLEKLSSKLFQNLASLEFLKIGGCPMLKSLLVQRLPPSLKRLLIIGGSRKLTGKCEKGKGKYWPHLAHIPCVDVDGYVLSRIGIQREAYSDRFPCLLLFPEGTTTNGRVLISFQLGAIVPGYPVHLVIVRYPHVHFDQSSGNIALGKLMFRMFKVSQFHRGRENPSLHTVEMANVESDIRFKQFKSYGLSGYISIHESKFQN